jgi:hypothetical protein
MVLLALVVVAAVAALPAGASQLISRDVSRPTLTIDRHGVAHISYFRGGQRKFVAAWGAINARTPSRSRPQVKFHIRYNERGRGVCRPYDGPHLAYLVKACTAPDGSYWALQSWKRLIRGIGGTSGAVELHLSHWRGAIAQLEINQNWVHRRFRHIFGRLTYRGVGVFGFNSTPHGNPLDSYGRNIYVDTFDSRLGKGWHRVGGFLTHHRGHTKGDFCFAFYPRGGRPSGNGTKYRASVEGPGVTPDVMWQANDIGKFDWNIQHQMRALELSWRDPKCRA